MNAVAPVPSWAAISLLFPFGVLCLAQLVCFVLVVVQMFKQGETGMGLACIALSFCAGLGGLFAFIYGWLKSSQWGLRPLMLVWTGCFLVDLLLFVGIGLMTIGWSHA